MKLNPELRNLMDRYYQAGLIGDYQSQDLYHDLYKDVITPQEVTQWEIDNARELGWIRQ